MCGHHDRSEPDPEQLPLALLVARAQSRDPAAWGEIVYRLGPLVLTWAQQFGLKPEDAEDTAPEVFLAVFEHLEWFDGKLPEWNFYAWVRRITKNKVRQRLRTRRGRRVEPEALGGSLAQALLAEAPQPAPADGGEADHCESDQRTGRSRRSAAPVPEWSPRRGWLSSGMRWTSGWPRTWARN